jgi:hypothetical protein
MNNISNTIFDYFVQHFAELTLDKQLHFASRLGLWRKDTTCLALVEQLRSRILPTGDVGDTLRGIYDGTLLPLRPGSSNALSIRTPYFERYPRLRQASTVLYWANLLDSLYGTEARSKIEDIISGEELTKLYDELSEDSDAIAILSTHAINFMYLYQRYMQQNIILPDMTLYKDITASYPYDLSDPVQLQLYIYLVAHCVIGESLFYTQTIQANRQIDLHPLLGGVENTIEQRFDMVNLDNKFEFLVCCKLVAYTSRLESRIMEEATTSASSVGLYLVDHPSRQSAYTSFGNSEHRNALYIMACSKPELGVQAA